MSTKHVYLFIGTTAELIKLVPIIQELNNRKINFTIIASGQNDIHFEEFAASIGKAKILYAVTPKGKESSLILFSIWAIRTFFSLVKGMKGYFKGLNKTNSLFIVHGDTVSSLMGSLVATVYGLKLVHIESGLRSFNFLEPFPEEICRYIISRLADIHFCPNAWAGNNLKHVQGEKINTYENTLIETFWSVMSIKSYHPLIDQLQKQKKRYFVLVIHRQEHVLFGKRKTTELLKFVLSNVPKKMTCIFLVHDLSAGFIHALGSVIPQDIANTMVRVSRLAYGDFMHLLMSAEFMITDGGSNQEEMYYMGKPCLILRNRTERIEGLNNNVVLSKNKKSTINHFLNMYKEYNRAPVKTSKLPSKIIVDYLFIQNI
jgi:UDP-N-acetylglucosamine 2-epimerase (non-hydrolysing)